MQTVILPVIAVFVAVGVVYILKLRQVATKHENLAAIKERELKRKVLELQVLRSLGERVGYSLDLHQILEVMVDSLHGLVDFSTVAYMLPATQGKIIFNIHISEAVSHNFLDITKKQMLSAFSAMLNQDLQMSLVEETVSGSAVDDQSNLPVGSFFNLPIVIGGKVVALINVSSAQKDLYGDEETAILYTILGQVSSQASKLTQVIENEKRRLSSLISSLIDGVMMIDPGFNLIVSNPTLSRLLGISGEINLLDVAAAVGERADLKDAIQKALYNQQLVKIPEFELLNSAVEINVEPVKDKYGYLLGVVVVFHDVTARRQLEKLREEFTAMMVHELRTPLTTIKYGSDMLLTDLPKASQEEIRKNITVVKDSAAEMLSLVNDLLDVAKIEAGKFAIVKQENDLKAVIDNKVVSFKPVADQKQLQLAAHIDANLPHFSFDSRRIEQALNNLLSNALKYTDSGQVTIEAKVSDEEAHISVADTGDGIKSEDISKLFSKFEQLGKGKTGERSGSGLGLVITKGIIEAHGGKIWVSSPGLGKGTTFTFSLPLK